MIASRGTLSAVPELVQYLVGEGFAQATAGRFEPTGRGRRRLPTLWWWVMRHDASDTDVAVLIEDAEHLAAPVLIAQGGVIGTASAAETAGVAASFAATGSTFWTRLAGIRADRPDVVRGVLDQLGIAASDSDHTEIVQVWADLAVPSGSPVTAAGMRR